MNDKDSALLEWLSNLDGGQGVIVNADAQRLANRGLVTLSNWGGDTSKLCTLTPKGRDALAKVASSPSVDRRDELTRMWRDLVREPVTPEPEPETSAAQKAAWLVSQLDELSDEGLVLLRDWMLRGKTEDTKLVHALDVLNVPHDGPDSPLPTLVGVAALMIFPRRLGSEGLGLENGVPQTQEEEPPDEIWLVEDDTQDNTIEAELI